MSSAETTWVYVMSEPDLWTVGFYAPSGKWNTDSDHAIREDAARRCAWLNGSAIRYPDAAVTSEGRHQ